MAKTGSQMQRCRIAAFPWSGSAMSARAAVPTRHLTLPSRGPTKGYAFCGPLMSNVRPTSMNTTARLSHVEEVSLRRKSLGGGCAVSATPGLESRLARAARPSATGATLALCRERAIPSRARAAPLAKQSIQNRAFVQALRFTQEKVPSLVPHELARLCTRFCPSTSSVRQLVSKRVAAQRSWWRQPRPNPSVEGTVKRLRLLSAPHLER